MRTTRGTVVDAAQRISAAARRAERRGSDGRREVALIDDVLQRIKALDPADPEERAVVDTYLATLPQLRASVERSRQPGYVATSEAEADDQRIIDELSRAYARALRLPIQRRGFTRSG